MNVTIEEAYREACTALGESIVEKRLLVAELGRRDAAAAQAAAEAADPNAAESR